MISAQVLHYLSFFLFFEHFEFFELQVLFITHVSHRRFLLLFAIQWSTHLKEALLIGVQLVELFLLFVEHCQFVADRALLVYVQSVPYVVAFRAELEEKREEEKVYDECYHRGVDDPHEGEGRDVKAKQLENEEPEGEVGLLF